MVADVVIVMQVFCRRKGESCLKRGCCLPCSAEYGKAVAPVGPDLEFEYGIVPHEDFPYILSDVCVLFLQDKNPVYLSSRVIRFLEAEFFS